MLSSDVRRRVRCDLVNKNIRKRTKKEIENNFDVDVEKS